MSDLVGGATGSGVSDTRSWNVASSLADLHSFVMGDELADLATRRQDIVVLTADLMTSNRLSDFAARHPSRFVNVGIAEQNMMSMAAGLAACGMTPYVATFAAFASLLCAEQVRTDLAYTRLPVRILAHHAGVAMGFYGTSHHALEDLALTRAIPGLTVVSVADGPSTRAAIRATLDEPGPVYMRLGRGRERTVYETPPILERGRFINARAGSDAAIIATGITVAPAIEAALSLAEEGISVRVLDAVYIKPIDAEAILAAARETGAILTVEEHSIVGGLGSAVADVLARSGETARLAVHGIPDEFALIGPPTHLYRHYGLTADGITARVRTLLGHVPAPSTDTTVGH
jgi:transketolase